MAYPRPILTCFACLLAGAEGVQLLASASATVDSRWNTIW
eukprot:CAMPEP_0179340700 /NCGR_PEP_ID=MMETSP0797-20121207/69423_1 /TAXON_ID=47934 /ORGANISM="Dinophysis acuminata, Strain DAEP01" /LENGTH=39 /DNA_ID= /DNA_START= /DNA_END= /DNA_ORIENTATION=